MLQRNHQEEKQQLDLKHIELAHERAKLKQENCHAQAELRHMSQQRLGYEVANKALTKCLENLQVKLHGAIQLQLQHVEMTTERKQIYSQLREAQRRCTRSNYSAVVQEAANVALARQLESVEAELHRTQVSV